MARLPGYYDFNSSNEPDWVVVAFPDGDDAQVPDDTGVYRFVCVQPGDRHTLFTEMAPSVFGDSLRACYCQHVLTRRDKNTRLYKLYVTDGIGFEHCQCNEQDARKHKQNLISNLRPYFNVIIKFKIGDNLNRNPFNN